MQSHYTIPTSNQYPRQESNLICDLRKVACGPAHSKDVQNQPVPRPGVEPGPRPSESRMMSVSPPGQQQAVTREGLEPSRPFGHQALNPARLPFRPPGHSPTVDAKGVEPSSAGCKPTVFPLDDTPILQTSDLGGSRTHNVPGKSRVLCLLSYKASQYSVRESNPSGLL